MDSKGTDTKTTATLEQRLVAICQTVRNEALDPAIKEAEAIRVHAEREREAILEQARKKAEEIIQDAEKKASSTKKALQTSLIQASHQAVELLKQQIEKTLFNPALDSYIAHAMHSESETADLIKTLISSIEKEGIFGDITLILGKKLSKEKIIDFLGKEIMAKLKDKSIQVAEYNFGVTLKADSKHIMIDVSNSAVKELLSGFLRQEFRRLLFTDEAIS